MLSGDRRLNPWLVGNIQRIPATFQKTDNRPRRPGMLAVTKVAVTLPRTANGRRRGAAMRPGQFRRHA